MLDGATMPYPEFGGFLLWNGGAAYHEWATIVSQPFASGDYTPYGFPYKEVVESWYEQLGEAWDSESGYIWVQPFAPDVVARAAAA